MHLIDRERWGKERNDNQRQKAKEKKKITESDNAHGYYARTREEKDKTAETDGYRQIINPYFLNTVSLPRVHDCDRP